MSIINKITSLFTRKTSITTMLNGYSEAFFEDTAQVISNDAYALNTVVNIAVDKVVTNATRAPFRIWDGDTEITSGPVYELFNWVNPYMFGLQLWKATMAWRKLKGEAIWTFEPGFNGLSLPKEIYVHNPAFFESVFNKEANRIVLWKYHAPGGEVIPLLPAELIQFRVWNPHNEIRGENPLIPFEDLMQQEYLSDKNNLYMLRNKSTPAGLLTTEEPLTEDKAKEYIERWEKKHSGVNRAGRIAVLGSGLKYQAIGLSPAEMEYLSMKKWNRTTILSKFGVPPAVSGYKDDTSPLSGTDTKEQLVQFWNQSLMPELAELQSVLRSEFSTRWTPRLRFEFDTDEIPELQDDQEKLTARYINQVNSGILTINEVREEMNLDPVAWGHTWWTSAKQDIQLQTEFVGTDNTFPPEPEKRMTLFDKPPAPFSEIEKLAEWQKVINTIEPFENALDVDVNDWLYKQRTDILEKQSKLDNVFECTYTLPAFWKSAKHSLCNRVKPGLNALIDELAGDAPITKEFRQDALERIGELITILEKRIIPASTKEQIKNLFGQVKGRTGDFLRLEVMRIVNEVRMKTFLMQGIESHLYYMKPNGTIAYQNNEVKSLYEPFSDGRAIPFSLEGRAISLPIKHG